MALTGLADVVNVTGEVITLSGDVIGLFMTEPLIYFVGLAFVGSVATIVRKLMKGKAK